MDKFNAESFMDSLIRDTWDSKIEWESYVFDYGFRYLTIICIPNTKKYLKIEVFDMGSSSFVKTDFYKEKDYTHFDNVKSKEHRERVVRLIKAIKSQVEEKESIIKNY